MQNLKRQKGMATVLLVLLVGISVMLLTASVAKSMISRKEASVAAHAQTNAQLMGWAGVSAFREFVLAQGSHNLAAVSALNGQTVTLRNDADKKEIIAKNIKVSGCVASNPVCTISADISSDNKTAQAATTIQVMYELNLASNITEPEKVALNFTGNTSFSGTTIRAEVPNSDVVINVKGNVYFNSGLKLENIRELNINATGDVIINCGTQKCGSTLMNIHAQGRVDLSDGGNYGVVKAGREVSLSAAKPKVIRAQQIYSRSNVSISGESVVQQVRAVGNVQLTAGAYTKDIIANGWVKTTTSKVGSIQSRRYAYINDSTVENDIRVYETVEILANAKIKGSIYAKGNRVKELLGNQVAVTHSASKVDGTIYAKYGVYFHGLGSVNKVVSPQIYGAEYIASVFEQNSFPIQPDFEIPNVNSEVIGQEILAKMDFDTRIDVTAYKNDANYIFTHNGGMSRVFLNHLYNTGTDKTYMYENGSQYEVDREGNKTFINDTGFFIGDYKYKYSNRRKNMSIGAICRQVDDQGVCNAQTTDIIGFLPRLAVGKTAGIDNDFDFTHTSPRKTWILRTASTSSSIDNPAFAPGIFYFEGDVALSGHGNINADSMTSAFTNTILAEGDIRAETVAPRIYSPYNLIREGDEKVALICDRTVKDPYGSQMTEATIPATYSTKYLVPVNLCKNSTEFAYNMNRAEDGTKLKVNIDGVPVDKLDLGYVALMANKNISIGTCARIYGDVFARASIAGTASCGVTNNKNQIVGSLATQGVDPYVAGIQNMNTFSANSTLIVPNSKFTNAQNTSGSATTSGVSQVNLQWSRYK